MYIFDVVNSLTFTSDGKREKIGIFESKKGTSDGIIVKEFTEKSPLLT